MDFSKGLSLHRLYGHSVFVIEADKRNKDNRFIDNICETLHCSGNKRYEPGSGQMFF